MIISFLSNATLDYLVSNGWRMTPCINTLPALMTLTMIFIWPILILMTSTRFHHIIAGLPEEYCQAMLHISSNSDVQILRSTLRQHSERLIIEKQHKKLEDNTKPLEPTVLYNRQQEPTNLKCKFKNSENSLSSSTKQPSICQYCKNCGHTLRQMYFKEE